MDETMSGAAVRMAAGPRQAQAQAWLPALVTMLVPARVAAVAPAFMSARVHARMSSLVHALVLVFLLALACGASGPARAQLADPTRPPPEAQLVAGAQAAPVRSGPQLQSVLNGNHGRQVAVIDGQALRVGDKINGATLVQVGKDQVVLQHGRVRQVLKLYPDASAASGTIRRQRASNTAPEN